MPIGAADRNHAALNPSHQGAAAKWPADRWSDANHAFVGLGERLADLGEQADAVRRVDPGAVEKVIVAHLAALQLHRQLRAEAALPNNVLVQARDLPQGPQRDEVVRKAQAFEQANVRLSEAVDELEYELRRAMDDMQRPTYTTVGRARWDPNEAIAILRSYLRTGLAPAGLGGPAAPRPPLGSGAVIPQLQSLQQQLKVSDEDFIILATEHVPRLAVLAAGAKGARPEQVRVLDQQVTRAAQLREQVQPLEDIGAPLPADELAALNARISSYDAAVSAALASERSIRTGVLEQSRDYFKTYPGGANQAAQALDALAQRAARLAPQEASTGDAVALNFFARARAASTALGSLPPEHRAALAEQIWQVGIAGKALTNDAVLQQRCPDGARVGSPRSDPVCNLIHSDLQSLELELMLRGGRP
jgi:hypothetical protein